MVDNIKYERNQRGFFVILDENGKEPKETKGRKFTTELAAKTSAHKLLKKETKKTEEKE